MARRQGPINPLDATPPLLPNIWQNAKNLTSGDDTSSTGGTDLSRRERQIMDVIWRRGRATVAEVRREMPDPPSYSAVRTLLGLLEQKGHLRHEQDGPRYVYLPTADREKEQRTALRHLVRTFFDGSAERAMAALLDLSDSKLSEEEVRRLARLLEQARSQGR